MHYIRIWYINNEYKYALQFYAGHTWLTVFKLYVLWMSLLIFSFPSHCSKFGINFMYKSNITALI